MTMVAVMTISDSGRSSGEYRRPGLVRTSLPETLISGQEVSVRVVEMHMFVWSV